MQRPNPNRGLSRLDAHGLRLLTLHSRDSTILRRFLGDGILRDSYLASSLASRSHSYPLNMLGCSTTSTCTYYIHYIHGP